MLKLMEYPSQRAIIIGPTTRHTRYPKVIMPEDIKATLWKATDKLRAQMDAAEYKHIVLSLIFLKYISDTSVYRREKVRRKVSDPKSQYFTSQGLVECGDQLEEPDHYAVDSGEQGAVAYCSPHLVDVRRPRRHHGT